MTKETIFTVPEVSCDHCVGAITKAVSVLEGVTDVAVNLDTKAVTVVGGDPSVAAAAIEEAGYEVADSSSA